MTQDRDSVDGGPTAAVFLDRDTADYEDGHVD